MRIGISVITIFLICNSCVSEKEDGVIISDATLFEMAQNVSSFSYFENNSDTLNTDPSSPHFAFVRVRFNPRARSGMNDSLNLLTAATFPEESMIVKEVYGSKGGALTRYEIMYKLHGASNSASGWVWSELAADGTPIYTSINKGDQCISCHSLPVNSDFVRTFSLH
ncbi:MAG: cytochrome P460 family protein [bacterium]